uniref:protein SPT2 homolog n=1 Tax=Myxine glutinosa TaxID=7769 RepID=UPI00358FFD56
MNFSNLLSVASQNSRSGVEKLTKRYTLNVPPSKMTPHSKGVQADAVKTFLQRKKETEQKQAVIANKKKDELLAIRTELKTDRRARAMASRTKDNFHGYDGIPIVEGPKGRQSNAKRSSDEALSSEGEAFKRPRIDRKQDLPTPVSEALPDKKSTGSGGNTFTKASKVAKPPPRPIAFGDLLQLAEKKQHEPVPLPPIVQKVDERPLTSKEIQEREYFERRRLEKELLSAPCGANKMKNKKERKTGHGESVRPVVTKPPAERHSSSKTVVPSRQDVQGGASGHASSKIAKMAEKKCSTSDFPPSKAKTLPTKPGTSLGKSVVPLKSTKMTKHCSVASFPEKGRGLPESRSHQLGAGDKSGAKGKHPDQPALTNKLPPTSRHASVPSVRPRSELSSGKQHISLGQKQRNSCDRPANQRPQTLPPKPLQHGAPPRDLSHSQCTVISETVSSRDYPAAQKAEMLQKQLSNGSYSERNYPAGSSTKKPMMPSQRGM